MKILITGASSGIGRALAIALLDSPCDRIYVVARRFELLQELKSLSPKIYPIQADVSTEKGRELIAKQCEQLTHVVHNAGVVEPVAKLKDVKLDDYQFQMATNVEGPFFLTQSLLSRASKGCRFLFVSSGAACIPWQGIGTYSISKAALKMVCEVFKQEYANGDFLFTSLRPGGVETQMLKTACGQSEDVFPARNVVMERKKSGELLKPEESAQFIRWVLLESNIDEYEKDWNINDVEDKATFHRRCATT